jgi:hypothetical protein
VTGCAPYAPSVSNQYPGQPGEVPPTQVAPSGVPPQQPGYPQQPGFPPPPQAPYGAPGGGGGFPPPGGPSFPAPPTGGGGGKKIVLIIAIVVAAVVLIGGGITTAILVLSGDDDSDDGDDARDRVTQTVQVSTDIPTTIDTSIPTSIPTSLPTDISSILPPTTDAGAPTENPEITSRAYLDSLVTGNCLAVQGLSTPEWFESEYGNQRGCKQASPQAEMSGASYEFQPTFDNGDGSVTVIANVTAPDGTAFTATWTLVPSDDSTTWLVNFFVLV